MANISKEHREQLIKRLHGLGAFVREHASEESARALIADLNEIEAELCSKKFGLVFEEHSEESEEGENSEIPVLTEESSLSIDRGGTQNYIIEGDNLSALKLLERARKGTIDVIYIDPPYNTGNRDFTYNDEFVDREDKYRHSKWLSFMKKRLEIARRLLSAEGVIFISIDDNELSRLNLLMTEIFGEANFIGILPRITKKSGKEHSGNIAKNHDYVLVYTKDRAKSRFKGEEVERSDYPFCDEYENERGGYKLNQPLDYDSLWYNPAMDFPLTLGDKTFYPGGSEEKYGERQNGVHRSKDWVWRWSKAKFEFGYANGFVVVKEGKDRPRIYTKTYSGARIERDAREGYRVKLEARESNLSSVALIDNAYSNDNAKKELARLMDPAVFDFPKPVSLIKKLLSIIDKEHITVLDFFAGSGTTGQAALERSAELPEGKIEFILVNNNENGICRNVTYPRIKAVIERENLKASVKYFKVGGIGAARRRFYQYAEELVPYILPLVELENGVSVRSDDRVRIILSDGEFAEYLRDVFGGSPCRTVYLGPQVLPSLAEEQKLLARGVEIIRIPDRYYGDLK